MVFGWVREVSERLHASGVYSSRERINRNEQAQLATIEVAEGFCLKSLLPQKIRFFLTIVRFRTRMELSDFGQMFGGASMKEMSDDLLRRYNRLLRQMDEYYRGFARSMGCGETTVWLLYALLEEPGCTQSHLCDVTFQPKQSINSALKKLEQEGCVTLQTTEKDKRSKHVFLTEKGKTMAAVTAEKIRAAERQALSASTEDTETMLQLMESFNQRLSEAFQPLFDSKGQSHDH